MANQEIVNIVIRRWSSIFPDMASAWHIFLTILLNTEFIVSILAKGFIALVNCIDGLKRRKMSSADRILTALGISRIGLIWVMIMNWFTNGFYSSLYMKRMEIIFTMIAGVVANHFSNWFATGLSLFYFLKIANFSNPDFLHLKRRVEMVVLVVLLGALVFLPFNLIMISMYISIQIHSYERTMTLSPKQSDTKNFLELIIFTMGSFLPFLISLNVFILLIFSLWKHVKNMKHSATGFRDANVKVHIRARKSVISFLVLFAIYFLSVFITVFYFEVMKNGVFAWSGYYKCLSFSPLIYSDSGKQ